MPGVASQQLELEVTPTEPPEKAHQDGNGSPPSATTSPCPTSVDGSRAAAADLLDVPEALLTRSHLRALGLERRAVDAVFRALPVIALPGYSRPMIRAHDYLALIAQHTYRGDRVRPAATMARQARHA